MSKAAFNAHGRPRSASYNMQVVAAETTDNSLTYQEIAGPIHKQTDRVLMD